MEGKAFFRGKNGVEGAGGFMGNLGNQNVQAARGIGMLFRTDVAAKAIKSNSRYNNKLN